MKLLFSTFFILLINTLPAQQYNFKDYHSNSGLLQNQIISIYQDHYGFMWFGAGGGLTRYDGENWIRFRIQNGLPDNQILSISGDDSAYIWIGTANGIARINISDIVMPHVDKVYQAPDAPFKDVNSLQWDNHGTLWIGTSFQGLFYLENGIIKSDSINKFIKNDKILNLILDKNLLYVVTPKTIFCINTGRHRLQYSIKSDQLYFTTLLPSLDQSQLIVGTDSGIYLYLLKENRFLPYLPSSFNKPDKPYIFEIKRDKKDCLWIVSVNGIYKVENIDTELITQKNGLPANGIRTIYIDRENNYWFGSINCGLFKLSNAEIYNYDNKSGLKSGVVNSILKENDSRFLLGTDDGVYRIRNKLLSKDKRFAEISDKIIWHVYQDHSGNLWAGGERVLCRYSNGRLISYPYKKIIADNIVFDMLQDQNGVYWFATQRGLFTMRQNEIKKMPPPQKSIIQSVFDVEELHNGDIAAAGDNGLIIYHKDSISYYNKQAGLPINSVFAIYEDADNTLWLGCDLGLIRFKDNRFTLLSSEIGLHGTVVTAIADDGNGNLWIGDEEGLENFSIKEMRITRFISMKDGLVGNEFTTQHSIVKNGDRLWLGLFGGLTVLHPDNLHRNLSVPPIYFSVAEYYENGGESVSFRSDPNIKIPFNQNNITFDFFGLYFYDENSLSYSYQLKGVDNKPKNIGRAGNIRYSNLWPGNYVFTVQPLINGKPIGEKIEKKFTILKPFWMQWYFYLLITLVLGAVIYLIYHYKTKRIYKRNIELEEKIKERTRELAQTKANIEKIIETAGSAIVTVDENNRITTWNKKASQVFRFSKSEMIGSTLDSLDRENDAIPFKDIINKVRNNGKLVQVELHKINREKEDVELILTATTVKKSDGSIHLITFAMEDFSERNKLINAQMNREKMLASIEAMNRLMATLSHYLNNALMSITLLAELSQMDKRHVDKLLKTISVQSARITGMLKSLGSLISEVKLKTRDYAGEEGHIFDIEVEINKFVKSIKDIKNKENTQ